VDSYRNCIPVGVWTAVPLENSAEHNIQKAPPDPLKLEHGDIISAALE
jgi:hypothetical protein